MRVHPVSVRTIFQSNYYYRFDNCFGPTCLDSNALWKPTFLTFGLIQYVLGTGRPNGDQHLDIDIDIVPNYVHTPCLLRLSEVEVCPRFTQIASMKDKI